MFRTLKISLINCEINLILNWSENFVIAACTAVNQATAFARTDTKLYVPVVTLSTNNSAKLSQQLKSELKHTIKWNKYQSKATIQRRNQYFD